MSGVKYPVGLSRSNEGGTCPQCGDVLPNPDCDFCWEPVSVLVVANGDQTILEAGNS